MKFVNHEALAKLQFYKSNRMTFCDKNFLKNNVIFKACCIPVQYMGYETQFNVDNFPSGNFNNGWLWGSFLKDPGA